MDTEDQGDECGIPEKYRVHNLPAEAHYVPEWVSEAEEARLLARVAAAPRPKWTQLARRRLQSWGGHPSARGMLAERLPAWLARETARLPRAWGGWPAPPNHVLVNEYLPGQGILPHLDGDVFHPVIATVSLGSHAVLRFSDVPEGAPDALLLEPRSLVLLRGALYARHLHGIEERTHDVLDARLANLARTRHAARAGDTLERGTRVSLTMRYVPNTTTFKLGIGNMR